MIEWREGKPDTASFRCPHCKGLIEERHKARMVTGGKWRATRPVIGHAGFRLNALVSLLANASWGKLAAEFIQAKDDPAELQTFVNTILAQGWREAGSEIDETSLIARAEPFDLNSIPPEVLAITIGCDTQDDRLEATVVGWTRESVALVLGHFVIWGSFTDQSTWDELDELLRTRWKHPKGGMLKVDAALVDSGDGDHYDYVMSFCVPRLSRRVLSVEGHGRQPPRLHHGQGQEGRRQARSDRSRHAQKRDLRQAHARPGHPVFPLA